MLKSIADKGKQKEVVSQILCVEYSRKLNHSQPPAEPTETATEPVEAPVTSLPEKSEKSATDPYNAAHYSTGRAAASLTSTSFNVATKSDRALIDEEEYMYDQIKDKGYVRLVTNFGKLNLELHCDRVRRVMRNWRKVG